VLCDSFFASSCARGSLEKTLILRICKMLDRLISNFNSFLTIATKTGATHGFGGKLKEEDKRS